MKLSILAMLAAGAAIAAAAPSAAQPWGDRHDRGGYDHGPGAPGAWSLDRRIDWMQHRIDRGRRDGSLDRREAYRAQASLNDINRDMRRMQRRNGGMLDDRQRDMLSARLDRLNDQIHWLRQNDERRPW